MPHAAVHAAVERRVPRLALVPQSHLRAKQSTKTVLPHKHHQQQVKATKRRQLNGERSHHEQLFGASDGVEAVRRSGEHNAEDDCEDGGADDDDEEDDVVSSEEQQQQLRLGERFLRMMAAMARLAHMPVDDHDRGGGNLSPSPQTHSQQSTALEKIVQKKEAMTLQRLSPHKATVSATDSAPTGGGSPAKGAAAPLLVPVNAATEPLRPHLTFEISMLLPQPLDTRQSSLQSPIQRKQLRPPRRRRKRRRRPRDEKRSWLTSHATWAPRASAAYIEEHSRLVSHSSKLVDKFAQLKKAAEPPSQMAKSSSMPALQSSKKSLYAFPPLSNTSPRAKLDHEDSGDDDDDEGCGDEDEEVESESDGQAEDEDARRENNEPTFSSFLHSRGEGDAASHTYHPDEAPPPTLSISTAAVDSSNSTKSIFTNDDGIAASPSSPAAPPGMTTNVAMRKRPLFHQPAWISPELKTWLISSGMFPTKSRHAAATSGAVLR